MSSDSSLIQAWPLFTEPFLTPFISASKARQSEHAAPTGGWKGAHKPNNPGPKNLTPEPAQNPPCQTTRTKRKANVAVRITFQTSLVVAGGSDQTAHQEKSFGALELEPVIEEDLDLVQGTELVPRGQKFLQLKSQKGLVALKTFQTKPASLVACLFGGFVLIWQPRQVKFSLILLSDGCQKGWRCKPCSIQVRRCVQGQDS